LANPIHSRVVRQACELVGTSQLADRVRVSRASVETWLTGAAAPPPRAFRTMLYILRKANPAYRPQGDEPAAI
jgi:DNA-binding transcriptional regulator YiaG